MFMKDSLRPGPSVIEIAKGKCDHVFLMLQFKMEISHNWIGWTHSFIISDFGYSGNEVRSINSHKYTTNT